MQEVVPLGVLTGLLAAGLALLIGNGILAGRLDSFNAAARFGMCGLLGFGAMGTLAFLLGLFESRVAPLVGVAALAAFGAWGGRHSFKSVVGRLPKHPVAWLLLGIVAVLLLLRVPAALSPSAGFDWDTISHQLAMAKIWLQNGRVDYIPFMHQSNIPATANMLYMLVLPFGGQFAAKVMGMFFAVFTAAAVGGMAEQRYGKNAGWWAATVALSAPVLLWEVGTAYIDVFHGGAFAVAALLAAGWMEERSDKTALWMSGLFLALALATKYTALQTGFALGVGMLAVGAGMRAAAPALKGALTVGAVALVLAAPWYVRNVANTGNPVYPFFYTVFGGKNWSEAHSVPYTAEQQSFGIGQTQDGGKDVTALPGSVAALALLPHTQINAGTPLGAVGPAFLLGLLWWPFSGMKGRGAFEKTVLLTALIALVSWFFLTQQSRYIISLVALIAPLVGGAVVRLPLGQLLAAAVLGQSAYSAYLFAQEPLAIPDKEAHLERYFSFWEETKAMNALEGDPYVAIYDEVRGYYLDVRYFWANPGHHTMLPYESYESGADLVNGLRQLGVTHVQLNLSTLGPEQAGEIRRALVDPTWNSYQHTEPFRQHLVEAIRDGSLRILQVFHTKDGEPRSILLDWK